MKKFVFVDPFPSQVLVKSLCALIKMLPKDYKCVFYVKVYMAKVWKTKIAQDYKLPSQFVDNIKFVEEDDFRAIQSENVDDDIFYFTNVESNLVQLKNAVKLKGLFLINLPFAANNDYMEIVNLLKNTENEVKFTDFYNMKCVRSLINDFFRNDKFYSFLLSREYVATIILQDMNTDRKVQHGIVFDVMQHFFINNLISIAKDNSDLSANVCKHYMQRMERLKLIRSIRKIKDSWFRCFVYHHIYDRFSKTSDRSVMKDTFTCMSMQIYNTRWFGVKIAFSAGRGFKRIVDRTVIKFTKLAFKRIYSRYYHRDIYDDEREEIRYICLIFQDFPEPKIYVKIELRRSIRRLVLMNADDINELITRKRGSMDEYEYFFHCLFNHKDVFYVRLEELEESYRIFSFFYNNLCGYGVYAVNAHTPNLLYEMIGDDFKD